jgi:hypothetical protein
MVAEEEGFEPQTPQVFDSEVVSEASVNEAAGAKRPGSNLYDTGTRVDKLHPAKNREMVAEEEGFEPSVPFGTLAFQASTIGHSVTPPALQES